MSWFNFLKNDKDNVIGELQEKVERLEAELHDMQDVIRVVVQCNQSMATDLATIYRSLQVIAQHASVEKDPLDLMLGIPDGDDYIN